MSCRRSPLNDINCYIIYIYYTSSLSIVCFSVSSLVVRTDDRQEFRTGGVLPACERYHVPKYVQKHIDYITPGIKLLAPSDQPPASTGLSKRQRSSRYGADRTSERHSRHRGTFTLSANAAQNLSTCDEAITPACIAALYQIPAGSLAHPNNSMGIFEAELQTWDQLDLNLFFTNFTRNIANGTHPESISVDGGVAITTLAAVSGPEAMLDLELAYPIVVCVHRRGCHVLTKDLHAAVLVNNSVTYVEICLFSASACSM